MLVDTSAYTSGIVGDSIFFWYVARQVVLDCDFVDLLYVKKKYFSATHRQDTTIWYIITTPNCYLIYLDLSTEQG